MSKPTVLPGTTLLDMTGDLAALMVAGIDRYLVRETEVSVARRSRHWHRDPSSQAQYLTSVAANRTRFRTIIGAGDERAQSCLQLVAPLPAAKSGPGVLARTRGYTVYAVRWAVLPGVDAEGLLLKPNRPPRANVIALPDCSTTPEMLVGLDRGIAPTAQFARRLAESGCQVLVPLLIDRGHGFAGTPRIHVSPRPHREFIYRAAYEMGRHLLGFEVQKVSAAVDGFQNESTRPTGVIGYGEGGLVALYAAAVDTRLTAAAVLGYFQPREGLWREPIDHNVWALLDEFGDAELASLVAPRPLIVEACRGPEWHGRSPSATQPGSTPGDLTTPPLTEVRREVERARQLTAQLSPPPVLKLVGTGNNAPGSAAALKAFLVALCPGASLTARGPAPRRAATLPDARARLGRQVGQLIEHTQVLVEDGERRRAAFWAKADASSAEAWAASCAHYRDIFWEQIIGKLPPPDQPPNPRSRFLYETDSYTGYEVVLDLYRDVFAYGILLLPKGMASGERRPVVVCQHGLEGRPQNVALPQDDAAYHAYGCRLAERGFVVFAPQNPYIGYDSFRVLQRQANPLRLSLFSFIVRQHERILEWLGSQSFVAPKRIGFYGISYGGKTAMRVPAILTNYALSICSADYNEWVRKNASTAYYPGTYLHTDEYEMFEFDLGNTFNYAEMSWLIFPRPFMVERGHSDGVGWDQWVGYEFAKTFRRYNLLRLPERAVIEWFDGPHEIHASGTFEFLHHWLNWPAPK